MIEEKIRKCLRKDAMTIEEVSKALGISRATASKYLLVLELKGAATKRDVGRAKLYSAVK